MNKDNNAIRINAEGLKEKLKSDPEFRTKLVTNTIKFLKDNGVEVTDNIPLKKIEELSFGEEDGFILIRQIMAIYES